LSATVDEAANEPGLDGGSAFERYLAIADRLPRAAGASHSVHRAHLGELVDDIDVFVLDGFGVLNVGHEPIAGAALRIAELKRAGCQVRVLTNGATMSTDVTCGKYARWGMDIARADVVSSRDALARALHGSRLNWGFMGLPASDLPSLVNEAVLLGDDARAYAAVDGFVLLGAGDWSADRQALLVAALRERARPVMVGNPDLTAPFPDAFSFEPGWYAHALQDAGVAVPRFFGKPFGNAFEPVLETLDRPVDPSRIAMVGDTLHTDILGGAAAGWRTVLVTGHGLLRSLDVERSIERAGIRPDWIVPTT